MSMLTVPQVVAWRPEALGDAARLSTRLSSIWIYGTFVVPA